MKYLRYVYVPKKINRDQEDYLRGYAEGMRRAVLAFLHGYIAAKGDKYVWLENKWKPSEVHFVEFEIADEKTDFGESQSVRTIRKRFLTMSEIHEFYVLKRIDVVESEIDEHKQHVRWMCIS